MTYIIAEAGVNHNGSIALAEDLIIAAADAGSDAIKFQAWKAENLVTNNAPLANYQKKNTSGFRNQFEMLKQLELSEADHKHLKKKCDVAKIEYLSSAFDLQGIEMLKNLGIEKLKIPSGEITNLPFLRKAGSIDWEIILSTGMSNLGEIEAAIKCLVSSGMIKQDITILQCTTEYPAPFEAINLSAMNTISKAFNIKVGYSDHTKGITAAIAAVALGAEVIEKHITLDRELPGPDHKASLEPNELKEMVQSIRDTESSLGNGVKIASECEISNIQIARKSIVAACEINPGDTFNEENLTTKRPGSGMSPMLWDDLIGKKSSHHFKKDDLIYI